MAAAGGSRYAGGRRAVFRGGVTGGPPWGWGARRHDVGCVKVSVDEISWNSGCEGREDTGCGDNVGQLGEVDDEHHQTLLDVGRRSGVEDGIVRGE
jgi:hypothetical protein